MSRKYRQQGYQDQERGERQGQAPREPRPAADRLRPERPRGRGLGVPSREVFRCARCGVQQAPPGEAVLTAVCQGCGTDLHTCTHCLHFDTSARFQCRRPIPEPISAKGKANQCTSFTARVSVEHEVEKEEPGDARSAFDALFKGL